MANNWPDGGEQPTGPVGMAVFLAGSWIIWGLMATALILVVAHAFVGRPPLWAAVVAAVLGFAGAGWALRRVAQGKA